MNINELEIFLQSNIVEEKDLKSSKRSVLLTKNYTLKELFIYLQRLNYTLYVQNTIVLSPKDLANVLRNERKKRSITRLHLLTERGVNFNLINKVECGNNYQMNTLKKYLESFPYINFDIKNSTNL